MYLCRCLPILNVDSGRISQFLQTRLKGVLHKNGDKWVPDSINSQGLTFNPAFLNAINTLSYISDVAFTEGNAGMVRTAPRHF